MAKISYKMDILKYLKDKFELETSTRNPLPDGVITVRQHRSIFFSNAPDAIEVSAAAEKKRLRETLNDILDHVDDFDYLDDMYGAKNMARGRVRVKSNLSRYSNRIYVSIDGDYWQELSSVDETIDKLNRSIISLQDYADEIDDDVTLANARMINSLKFVSVQNKIHPPIDSCVQYVIQSEIGPNPPPLAKRRGEDDYMLGGGVDLMTGPIIE